MLLINGRDIFTDGSGDGAKLLSFCQSLGYSL
jgi:hypothetical protein